MTTRKLTYSELVDAIEKSFEDDNDIFSMYDSTKKVETLDDIVKDVSIKIKDYGSAVYIGVFEEELIGYFVFLTGILISFAMIKKYRINGNQKQFFDIIKKYMRDSFVVFLWKNNVRAIKWLLNNGLKIVSTTEKIVKLTYQN
jgi:hypothetical protein